MRVKDILPYCQRFVGIGIIHSMSTTPEHHAARLAVAEEVLSLMGRRRVSQTTLATHLGMSQPALSKRLGAKQPFTMDELLEIAAYFDVEVTALLVSVVQGGSSSPWITALAGQLDLFASAA